MTTDNETEVTTAPLPRHQRILLWAGAWGIAFTILIVLCMLAGGGRWGEGLFGFGMFLGIFGGLGAGYSFGYWVTDERQNQMRSRW